LVVAYFKDSKDAAKYKGNLILFQGTYVFVGEAYENIRVEPANGTISMVPGKPLSFFVPDLGDPTKVPYKTDGDAKAVTNKKQVVSILRDQIGEIRGYMSGYTLAGLACDYAVRKKDIDMLATLRDSQKKGGAEWVLGQQRVVSEMGKLMSWFGATCFPEAARRLMPDLAKQQKVAPSEGLAARGLAARQSVKTVPTPPELVEASKKVSGGQDAFKVQESLHCRIVYISTVDDARIKSVLELAEQVIDGFRLDFVDPYADATFVDYVPDHVFTEFFFGPDDIAKYEAYFSAYYHQHWGDRKEQRLKNSNCIVQSDTSPEQLHYYHLYPYIDIEGAVVHHLGHDLAHFHYERGLPDAHQDWLQEGLALYTALEWLGQNNTSCTGAMPLSEMARKVTGEAQKSKKLSQRDYRDALALLKGLHIDKLAAKHIYELDDADLAASWSFIDYVVREGGKDSQLFLRACCDTARKEPSFMDALRAESEKIYNVKGQDVFEVINKHWKDCCDAALAAH